MYVYPITFYGTGGTSIVAHGELVTDMSLQTQYVTLVPAANGTEYSGYPGGTGLPQPTWVTVPNFLNQATATTINLSGYVTPSTGITLALSGTSTMPSGWTFGGGTAMAYNGTGTSTATPISVTATLTSDMVSATSNTFSLSGVGGTNAAETGTPTIPVGLFANGISQTAATIGGFPSSDPAPVSFQWSGMAQYNVVVTSALGTLDATVSSGTGNEPLFTFRDIGVQTSTITQGTGTAASNLTFTTTAVDNPYPTNSALAAAIQSLAGTSWVMSCMIPASFTSAGAYDNLRLEARSTLSTTGAYVAIGCTVIAGGKGVGSEARAAAGGSAVQIASAPNSAGPVWLFLVRSGDTYNFYWSLDGNTLNSLGSTTQVMGSTLFVVAGANTGAGGPMTAQTMQQVNVQTLGTWTQPLTGLTQSTSYTASVTAQDGAGNVSAAGTLTFTTANPTGTGSGATLPYPIIGNMAIDAAGPTYMNTAWQQSMARYNYVCFQGENWVDTWTPATAFSAMKSYSGKNPNLRLGFYTERDEHWQTFVAANNGPNGGNFDWALIKAGLNGPNGTGQGFYVQSSYHPGSGSNYAPGVDCNTPGYGQWKYAFNWTSACPTYNWTTVGTAPGPGVVNAAQFIAWYDYMLHVRGKGSAMNSGNGTTYPANSLVDFFFGDNKCMYPTRESSSTATNVPANGSGNACWQNNATIYNNSYGNANAIRPLGAAGWQMGFNMQRSLAAADGRTIMCGGNFDGVGAPDLGLGPQVVDAQGQGIAEIVNTEDAFRYQGPYYSWSALVAKMLGQEPYAVGSRPDYNWLEQEVRGPGGTGFSSLNQSGWTAADYQGARYKLGMALLLRWVYFISLNGQSFWMDEFDAGVGNFGWLGAPIGARNTTTPTNGPVFVIPFTGGKAYLYPAGTGDAPSGSAYQVNGVSGRHITYSVTPAGMRPPGVTSGATFTSIVVQPRDCILTLLS